MTVEREEVFMTLAGDIADWGERFLRVRAGCGNEAAQQVLGGIAEWLGTDLVDGMPLLPLERWSMLDELAEELLQGCRACATGEPGAEDGVRVIIDKARDLQ
jgi:hypothetical protein